MSFVLTKGTGAKKWKISFPNGGSVSFGASGYMDYTLVKDSQLAETKKNAYIARHQVNENWTKSGIKTAGFWARWLLWNKRTLEASIKDTESRFSIKVQRG